MPSKPPGHGALSVKWPMASIRRLVSGGPSSQEGNDRRIAIARALIHRPHLLILDEATSALDPKTEAAICQTFKELRGQLTILAISHQAAMVEVADRVFQISDGDIKQIPTQAAASAPAVS